jgi:hypothetical protein
VETADLGRAYTFHASSQAQNPLFASKPLIGGQQIEFRCSIDGVVFKLAAGAAPASVNLTAISTGITPVTNFGDFHFFPEGTERVGVLLQPGEQRFFMPRDASSADIAGASQVQLVFQQGGQVATASLHLLGNAPPGDQYCEVSGSVIRGPSR